MKTLFKIFLFSALTFSIFSLVGCNKENSETKSKQTEQKVANKKEVGKLKQKNNGNKGIWEGEITPYLTNLANNKFEYKIQNHKTENETLTFNTGQRFDFCVINEKGEIVYSYSKNMMFTQAIGEEVLKPGDVLKYQFDLSKANLKSGKYTLNVWMVTAEKNQYEISMEYIQK